MLEYLTKLQINKNLRVNPSIEFIETQSKDFKDLSLDAYLKKYYSKLDVYNKEVWDKIMLNLVNLAYDNTTNLKMVENFGYSSIDKHDFIKQYQFYNELKIDSRLDEEMKKFIGFMAGNHFFDKYVQSINEWFNSYYWTNPYLSKTNPTEIMSYTINEILNLPYGLNYLKEKLPQLNHWRR
jgi:hypothetical protein